MILMLSFQEHAKLIPVNTGYDNLKTPFPVVTYSESEIFSLNYLVQHGKKICLLKKKSFSCAMHYFCSLGFEFNLVLFSVISTIKTYTENITTERHHCNRKVFLVIKLP